MADKKKRGIAMSDFKSISELKKEAKDLLDGRWKDAILLNLSAILVIWVVVFALIGLGYLLFEFINLWNTPIVNSGTTYMNDWHNTSGGGGSSGGGILSSLLSTGIMYTFIDWHRNPSMEIRPLKDAFQVFSRKYILPVGMITFLMGIFTFFWSLLFVIPGIIKTFAYSQAPYIYKDLSSNPDIKPPTALESITESRQLMDGHKMRYFMLEWSFIGWMILSVFTLGIGFLWLIPYMNATNAAFYNDLAQKRYRLDAIELDEETTNEWTNDW